MNELVKEFFNLELIVTLLCLIIGMVLSIVDEQYWGACMSCLLMGDSIVIRGLCMRSEYWKKECFKALGELGFCKAKLAVLESALKELKNKEI